MSSTTATATATEEPPPLLLIPSLPNDVALNCLARIPRCHYPTLSLVSKPIRSLLSSPLLYTTRSLLNCTQHFLYLSFRVPTKPSPRWYTLYQNPQTTTTTDNRKSNILIPIPPIASPSLIGSAFVAVGPYIYVFGGSINDVLSSRVWVLDCRFHSWRSAPNMRVGREFAAAGVIGDKIFVIGGCVPDTWAKSKNWVEAFDLKMQSWESISSPVEIREKWMHASAVMEGRIYAMADRNGVVYEPRKECWEVAESELDLGWRGKACVIEEVLYCYDYLGKIRGYDAKERAWRELKGVEKGLPRFLCGATMANFGGKLAVLWEGKGGGNGKEIDIWCAEIAVERGEGGELWGRIEWSDLVLRVPTGSAILHCLAVTF